MFGIWLVPRNRLKPWVLFDLVNGPLMKACLVRLNADDHVLLLAFHHIVIDGWSTHVIVSDLSWLYSAKIRGGAHDPAPSMQYRDYIRWYYEPETPGQAPAEWDQS